VILVDHCAVHDHEWQEETDNYSNSSFRKPYLLIESDWPGKKYVIQSILIVSSSSMPPSLVSVRT
jgi:hypothetical protein